MGTIASCVSHQGAFELRDLLVALGRGSANAAIERPVSFEAIIGSAIGANGPADEMSIRTMLPRFANTIKASVVETWPSRL